MLRRIYAISQELFISHSTVDCKVFVTFLQKTVPIFGQKDEKKLCIFLFKFRSGMYNKENAWKGKM